MLEDVNCAYNDICLSGNGKLLVTSVPVHAMGTGIFDIAAEKFSYLYKMEMNEDGYEDFLWTTAPTRLNYNGHYGNFVNVSILEKTQYDDKVRSGKKSPNYQIDLVDADLNTKYKYTYTLKSEIDYTIIAVTQIAQDQVLLFVKKDLGEESELESKCLGRIVIIDRQGLYLDLVKLKNFHNLYFCNGNRLGDRQAGINVFSNSS